MNTQLGVFVEGEASGGIMSWHLPRGGFTQSEDGINLCTLLLKLLTGYLHPQTNHSMLAVTTISCIRELGTNKKKQGAGE